jgi:hypothetical protein
VWVVLSPSKFLSLLHHLIKLPLFLPLAALRRSQVRQRKLVAAFTSKKARFVEIDGMDPEMKETRGKLFDLSGLRGKYPQVLVLRSPNS